MKLQLATLRELYSEADSSRSSCMQLSILAFTCEWTSMKDLTAERIRLFSCA